MHALRVHIEQGRRTVEDERWAVDSGRRVDDGDAIRGVHGAGRCPPAARWNSRLERAGMRETRTPESPGALTCYVERRMRGRVVSMFLVSVAASLCCHCLNRSPP